MSTPTAPFRIDSVSPLVQYTPNDGTSWASVPGNISKGDTHTGQPFHSTSSSAATFAFRFFGTGLRVFGQTFPSTEPCTVTATVDGSAPLAKPSNPTVAVEFSGLASTNHAFQASISCPSNGATASEFRFQYADVDVGVVNSTIVDDNDPTITYQGNWTRNTNLASPGFFDDTQHYTRTPNDSVSFNFTAGGIAVYGSLQSSHGKYIVNVDDGKPVTLDGSNPFLAIPVLLFFEAGLDPTQQHKITLTNTGTSSEFLDVDSFTIMNYVQPTKNHSVNVAAILVAILCAFLVVFVPAFFFVRHRRTQPIRTRVDLAERGVTPDVTISEINSDAVPRPFVFPARRGSPRRPNLSRLRALTSPLGSTRSLPRSERSLPPLPSPSPAPTPPRSALTRQNTKQRISHTAPLSMPALAATPIPRNPSQTHRHSRTSASLSAAELDELAERVVRRMQSGGTSGNRRGHLRTPSLHLSSANDHTTTETGTTPHGLGEEEEEEETSRLADLVSQRVSSIHRRPYLAGAVGRYVMNGDVIGTPESDNPPPLYGE